ncbi:DUF805 domain-containing protein [Bartonella sp. HY761]|uniref:DUF805 domain-containing protein n=1 Tax=Bartonella sp. HY761 TaxID=2979330 RepID=UPI002204D4A4|nr:DUF805 domain-containing protein [Bartonella sp. HY761]UXN07097.1 DUF805 domain-containing protein [Bartonella sp. HY761]
MNFKTSLHTCFTHKYASTTGRASRSEYWWFALVFNIIYLILFLTLTYFIEPMDPQKPIYWLSLPLLLIPFVIFFIPFASVSIRRFHDIGMAGWHFWFVLIALQMPYVGEAPWLYYIYLLCKEGSPDSNRYGKNPFAKMEYQKIFE